MAESSPAPHYEIPKNIASTQAERRAFVEALTEDRNNLSEAERREWGQRVLNNLQTPKLVNLAKGLESKHSMLPEIPAPTLIELTELPSDQLAASLNNVNMGTVPYVTTAYDTTSALLQAVEARKIHDVAAKEGYADIAAVALHSALTHHFAAGTPTASTPDNAKIRGVSEADTFYTLPVPELQEKFDSRI